MIKRKFMWFLEGDKDGGGDGGDDSSVADILGEPSDTNDDGDPNDDGSGGDDANGEPKPKAGAPATVDIEALTKSFGDVIGQHFQKVSAQNEPKPPALTADEAKKMLQLFEPDETFLKEFGDLATQGKALVKFRDGILRTAYIMAEMQRQQMEQTMEGRFTPIQSMLEAQSKQALVKQFDDSYPQLANPALRPLLDSVATSLGTAKKLGNDPQKNFQLIAEAAEAVIKATSPEFKLEPKGSATKKPATQTRSGGIPVVTQGGGGGGGGSSRNDASEKGLPKLATLLGKVPGG